MKDKRINPPAGLCGLGWIRMAIAIAMLQFAFAGTAAGQHTIISGQIQKGSSSDTLIFSYIPNYQYNLIGEQETIIPCDGKGRFRFVLDDAAQIGRMAIMVKGATNGHSLHHYLQRGDSIFLDLRRGARGLGFQFSGPGAEKFTVKHHLDSLSAVSVYQMRSIAELNPHKDSTAAQQLSVIFKRLDFTAKIKLAALQRMQSGISPEIYALMRADIESYALERKYFNYWFAARQHPLPAADDPLVKKFHELETSPSMDLDHPMFRISQNYVELLIRMAVVRSFVYGNKGVGQTYQLLKYGTPRQMRDRAVSSYLLSRPKTAELGEYLACVRDARESVTEPLDQLVLDQLLAAYQQGAQLIDFSLIRADGKTFHSAQVKGKVVVMDFWFTGCTACIKQTSEINLNFIPKLKADRQQVTILSVNLDKKEQFWKQSLAGGKYSIEGGVELYTSGLAFQHPLAKFYQIQGCPRILVFDQQGKLVATDPDLRTLGALIDRLVPRS